MFVFLSHAGQEKPAMRELSTFLFQHMIPHFLDEKNIEWGGNISSEVRQAIGKTTHFLIAISPQALNSGWVNYEIGIAEGISIVSANKIKILPWLAYPVEKLPVFLAGRNYMSSLAEVKDRLLAELASSAADSPKDVLAKEFGYERFGTNASAIRLIGAAGETFAAEDIFTQICDDPYIKPEELLHVWDDVLAQIKRRCVERGVPYHNSLHTRLVDYGVHVRPNIEQKQLKLVLGPLWWEEYVVPQWRTNQMSFAELQSFVNLEQIARTGRVSVSRLHNILDTATTLVTEDGYILYTARGQRVSVGDGMFTSCVAENISAEKDSSLKVPSVGELPAPFKAAIRGISEELSPRLGKLWADGNEHLVSLGLSFDLQGCHPDMLFFGLIPLPLAEVERTCREDPGEDFFEGKLRSIHLDDFGTETSNDIAQNNWTGGGKASCLRALEFLDFIAKKHNTSMAGLPLRLKLSRNGWRVV